MPAIFVTPRTAESDVVYPPSLDVFTKLELLLATGMSFFGQEMASNPPPLLAEIGTLLYASQHPDTTLPSDSWPAKTLVSLSNSQVGQSNYPILSETVKKVYAHKR